VVAFGFTVAEFFTALSAQGGGGLPVIAHFHEWMAGVAVPRIAHLKLPIATVFTTHATLLGRYLASDSPEFYNQLPFLNADEQAGKRDIYPRFAIERAAAHASTVVTTVSQVTGFEAEKLLGRQPDLILPNGLNLHRFAALHEFQNLHRQYKEDINEFVMGHFFPGYSFDLDRTIYLFTSGRYEYRNKGMDLFIEALYRLNGRLREQSDRPTVVAFIITKAATRNINVGVLQSQTMFEELRKTCEQIEEEMGQRLFRSAAMGRIAAPAELLDEDDGVRLKQAIHAWRTGRQPPIITHDLVDDANDPILQHLRHRGLFNAADDPVKVVFHPQFVTATSPPISLDYEQFVRGCHLGIFPSYYEPWGYTPMECVALGLPAVTTDLSGFGAYVQAHIPDHREQGIYVLNRRTHGFDETVNELVEDLVRFVQMNRRQRIEMRNRVERLGEMFDWSVLIRHYDQAHDLALSRGPVRPGKVDVRLV
jgi:glycogen(starch) synthase